MSSYFLSVFVCFLKYFFLSEEWPISSALSSLNLFVDHVKVLFIKLSLHVKALSH